MRETFEGWQVAVAALLLVLITVAAIYLARRGKPYVAVGWFWYLGTLLPVIGIVQVGDQAMADRYTYVPLIGPFIAIAWGAGDFAARIGARRVAGAAVACLFAGIIATFVQIGYWRDTATLFSHAVQVDDNNWLAWHELALYRAGHDDTAGAEAAYQRALRVKPLHFLVNYNYGNLLWRQQRTREAFDRFSVAVTSAPKFAEARANLGWTLLRADQIDNAELEFHEALRLKPNLQPAERGLAKAAELRAARP
jgi:tetratricopeptide (TPR) repeat protein